MTNKEKQGNPIIWNEEKINNLWDYYSVTPPYNEIYFSKVFGSKIIKNFGIPFNEKISLLDFGCGPGFIFDHLKDRRVSWEYTGVDASLDSIKTLISNNAGNKTFKGGYSNTQEIQGKKFDLIIMIEVIEHLTDEAIESTFYELKPLLKQNGRIILTTPNNEDLSKSTRYCPNCSTTFHEWQHIRSWNQESLQYFMLDMGFETDFIKTTDFSSLTLKRYLINLLRRKLNGTDLPHLIGSFKKNN
jgi:2-polyprenyl-3-methyl-5-hydroxy-6-metoxy-1,4-benzoquinol methylase